VLRNAWYGEIMKKVIIKKYSFLSQKISSSFEGTETLRDFTISLEFEGNHFVISI
jgi:hypothetical protein